jgi:hypothetical protein
MMKRGLHLAQEHLFTIKPDPEGKFSRSDPDDSFYITESLIGCNTE